MQLWRVDSVWIHIPEHPIFIFIIGNIRKHLRCTKVSTASSYIPDCIVLYYKNIKDEIKVIIIITHPVGRCNLAGVDHDEELHQVVIDFTTAGLNNVNILSANRFADFDTDYKIFKIFQKINFSDCNGQ